MTLSKPPLRQKTHFFYNRVSKNLQMHGFPISIIFPKTVSHLDFLRILGWIKSIQNAGKGTILHNDFGNFPGDTQNPIWSSWEPKFNLHNWAAFDPQKITDYLLFTYSFLYSSEEWSMKQCNGTSLYHGFILEIILSFILPPKAQVFIN